MATQGGSSPMVFNSSKISIITKSEIRYEGTLYHINAQDQSITLCNVRSFGTEGRRPSDEIGPSPQIHEYIIFRGSDIKDLKVIETPQTEEKPQQQGQAQQTKETTQPQEEQKNTKSDHKHQNKQPKMDSYTEEFNFDAMNEKFKQVALEHKKPEESKKYYSQDNFFDNLSSSTLEKDAPPDRAHQKQTDRETFGIDHIRRPHRGHRGGRGGHHGGGRGGYHKGGHKQGGGYRDRDEQGGHHGGYNKGGYKQGGHHGGYGGNRGHHHGGYRHHDEEEERGQKIYTKKV